MKRILISLALLCLAADDYDKRYVNTNGRLYTAADPSNAGGISGSLSKGDIRFALAIDQDRKRVYRNEGKGSSFSFTGVAVGKYDIVLVMTDGTVYEGLSLGEPTTSLSPTLQNNIQKRVAKADEFFNRSTIHRAGVVDDRVFVFAERIRDRDTLTQGGQLMDVEIRRLEVIQLTQASDDWQMSESRHLCREPEPGRGKHRPFLVSKRIPALGAIRVVDSVRQLGTITIPMN
jgi:hypothetical protein